MTDGTESENYESFILSLNESVRERVSLLHRIAVSHGCAYRIDPVTSDGVRKIVYSLRHFALEAAQESVTLCANYENRAFLEFYRNEADQTAKDLLFDAAIPCEFCINDKCTTLLTDRTIFNGEKRKRLCGPYRKGLRIPVSPENLKAAESIAEMLFRNADAEIQADLFDANVVGYEIETKPEAWVVGFKHSAYLFGERTEDFIEKIVGGENGERKIDSLLALLSLPDSGVYVGVTDNFIAASRYDYILGVVCDPASLPAELPDGVVKIKLHAGDYAVYNSDENDYQSVWRHFTDRFPDEAEMGYDDRRIPFEFIDAKGRFRDLSIPVSRDLPKNSGRTLRVAFTPDIVIAGMSTCNETDHPLYKDVSRFRANWSEIFPHAERVVSTSTHSEFGLPMTHVIGCEIDLLDDIPEGLDRLTLRGGYWMLCGYRHFTGGGGMHYQLDMPYQSVIPIDSLNHPRAFVDYTYAGRGGMCEVAVPIRKSGAMKAERVERAALRIVGKEQNPPVDSLSKPKINAFYDAEYNSHPGRFIAAFHYEMHNNQCFLAKPVLLGVETDDESKAPEEMDSFLIEGGSYAKITEDQPNGEYDWRSEWFVFIEMANAYGFQPDLSRSFIVYQNEFGKSYELYAPIK